MQKQTKQLRSFLLFILLFGGIISWWQFSSNRQSTFWQTTTTFIGAYSGWLLTPLIIFVLFHLVTKGLRIYAIFAQTHTMQTVKVILPRSQAETSSDIINFFDFLNSMLLPKFPWQYYFLGAKMFTWEIKMEQSGEKNIYLSAPERFMSLIIKNIRTIYVHAQFQTVKTEDRGLVPNEFMQLRLERHWKYSIETVEIQDKMGAVNSNKSFADSLFQTMDEVGGEAGIQVIMVPLNPYTQQRQQSKHRLAKIGGAIFRVEIRVYASSKSLLKGIIASFGEVNAQNNIVPENLVSHQIRQWSVNYWWSLVQRRIVSLFLGPHMLFASYQLAYLLQFPSAHLRVRGVVRYQQRRMPIPAGLPTDEQVTSPIAITDEGVKVGFDEAMLRNLLIFGATGTGKTTTLGQHASPWLARHDEAAVIICGQVHELMSILQYVPEYKKVYIIDMDKPSQYGVNFLSNDDHPAEMMIEDFISIFDPPFSGQMTNMDFLQQALLALRQVREISPEWRAAVPKIDLRHIKEVFANEKYRLRLIQSLPRDSTTRHFWIKRSQLMRNPRYYVSNIVPIINVFDRILGVDKVVNTLCHPHTIDLKKALLEEKAIVAFHTSKYDYGFNVGDFAGNMLITLLYHSVLHQRELDPEERVTVNLLLDECGGFCNRVMMMLMVRAWKIHVRCAMVEKSWFDIPEGMRIFLNIVFPNKVIFRSHTKEDAEHWSNWLDLMNEDDFLHLKHRYACLWFKAEDEQKDPIIAKALYDRSKAQWEEYHLRNNWPIENKHIHLTPVVIPKMEDPDESAIYLPPLK